MPGSTVPVATQPELPWATDQPANGAAPTIANTVGSGGRSQLTPSFYVHAAGSPPETHSPRYPFAMRLTRPGAGSPARHHPQPPASRSKEADAGAAGEGDDWPCRTEKRAAPPATAKTTARATAMPERLDRSKPSPLPGAAGTGRAGPGRRCLSPRSIGSPLARAVSGCVATPGHAYQPYVVARATVHRMDEPRPGRVPARRSTPAARSFERGRRPTGSSARNGPSRCRAGGSRSGPSG